MGHDDVPIRADVTTIISMPNGITDAGHLLRSSKSLPSLRSSTAPQYTIPSQHIALPNMQIIFQGKPSMKDMQLWATKGNIAGLVAPPTRKPRHPETQYTQVAVDLSHPLESRRDFLGAAATPPALQPKYGHGGGTTAWRPDERVKSLLCGVSEIGNERRPPPAAFSSLASRSASQLPPPRRAPRGSFRPYCSSLDRAFARREDRRWPTVYMSTFCAPDHGHVRHYPPLPLPLRPVEKARSDGPGPGAAADADGHIKNVHWRKPGRVTAAEAAAGRAWGPPCTRVEKETRSASEW
jgi:hypothetical protein